MADRHTDIEAACPTCGEPASAGHRNASGECSDAIHSEGVNARRIAEAKRYLAADPECATLDGALTVAAIYACHTKDHHIARLRAERNLRELTDARAALAPAEEREGDNRRLDVIVSFDPDASGYDIDDDDDRTELLREVRNAVASRFGLAAVELVDFEVQPGEADS